MVFSFSSSTSSASSADYNSSQSCNGATLGST
jgi:hypothetical protein